MLLGMVGNTHERNREKEIQSKEDREKYINRERETGAHTVTYIIHTYRETVTDITTEASNGTYKQTGRQLHELWRHKSADKDAQR